MFESVSDICKSIYHNNKALCITFIKNAIFFWKLTVFLISTCVAWFVSFFFLITYRFESFLRFLVFSENNAIWWVYKALAFRLVEKVERAIKLNGYWNTHICHITNFFCGICRVEHIYIHPNWFMLLTQIPASDISLIPIQRQMYNIEQI